MSDIFEGIDFSAFDKVGENQKLVQSAQDHVGGQIELPLADIVEDPNQPRRSFNQVTLEELAESIKKRGIVQPIIVRPKNEAGKYVIVMGARRYRASQLAGMGKIPAVIRIKPSDGYDQMIENIQRDNLLHTDIARFIEQEISKGEKPSNIALFFGKPRSWVSLYVGFSQMHEEIKERVEEFGIRAAYELQRAIEINEAATLAYIAHAETITQREATAFLRNLKKNLPNELMETSTVIIDFDSDKSSFAPQETSTPIDLNISAQKLPMEVSGSNTLPVQIQKKPSLPVVIIVQANGKVGRLITDKTAVQGSQFGIVSFDNGANIEEIALADIKLLEIMTIK